MTPVTHEFLAANAYRTLGISAASTQSQIEAAARRMRIWPEASRIPPTPWDLPAMGAPRRSKVEIERAVSLLSQPESRLEQRLLWFGGEQPPGGSAAIRGGSIAERHAAAVLSLQDGWIRQPGTEGETYWSNIIESFNALSVSREFREWNTTIESDGRFDKPATRDEIEQLIAELPATIAAGLVGRAVDAIQQDRIDLVQTLADAVGRVAPTTASNPARDLANKLEDLFGRRIDDLDNVLRPLLRINKAAPLPYYAANLEHTKAAVTQYEKQVLPVANCVLRLAATDPDRQVRLRMRVADLLLLLALGWEWSGQFSNAERYLRGATHQARGTALEMQASQELARVAALVIQDRQARAARPAGIWNTAPAANKPKVAAAQSNTRLPWIIAAIAISALLRGLTSTWTTSSNIGSSSNAVRNNNYNAVRNYQPKLPPRPVNDDPFPDPLRIAPPKPVIPTRHPVGGTLHEP